MLASNSTFRMQDESRIAGNKASAGGAAWIGAQYYGSGKLEMTGGFMSGNTADIGAGLCLDTSNAITQIENGVIYDADASADLANNGPKGSEVALYILYSGVASYGTFDNAGNFTQTDKLPSTVENTINVVNGQLK